ncbi:hypothetical protein KW448_08050 [Vibrio fluvialis]|nr:hypothetical protein [Vibrio fluvialis]
MSVALWFAHGVVLVLLVVGDEQKETQPCGCALVWFMWLLNRPCACRTSACNISLRVGLYLINYGVGYCCG